MAGHKNKINNEIDIDRENRKKLKWNGKAKDEKKKKKKLRKSREDCGACSLRGAAKTKLRMPNAGIYISFPLFYFNFIEFYFKKYPKSP